MKTFAMVSFGEYASAHEGKRTLSPDSIPLAVPICAPFTGTHTGITGRSIVFPGDSRRPATPSA